MQRPMMRLERWRPLLIDAGDQAARSPMLTQAARENRWLRLSGFVGLATVLVFVFSLLMGTVAYVVMGDAAATLMPDAPLAGPDRLVGEINMLWVLGIGLGALGLAVVIAATVTFRLRLSDLLWPGRRFDATHFAVGLAMGAAAIVVFLPVHYISGDPPEWTVPVLDPMGTPTLIAAYVTAAIGGLLIAAAAEEVVMRGVVLQVMGAFTRRIWLILLINGIAFSALHLDPDPVAFVARAISGVVWSWAALRLGGLEFATGAHLANNLVITLFLAPPSDMMADGDPASWWALGPQIAVGLLTILFVERMVAAGRGARLAART